MSVVQTDGKTHEIIIVRRARHDEDEGHHGGVWMIAFADFMTALMCFFLVMWLINAANEETRAALASYFNPVKLIDRNASRKGLDEMGGPQSTESAPENADDSTQKENLTEPSAPAPQPKAEPSLQKSNSDELLFSNPYAVLAEIAAETGTLQNTSSKGDGGAQIAGPASGASGGEAYRDPFAPDFWSQQVDVPAPSATAQTNPEPAPSAEPPKAIAEPPAEIVTEAVAEPKPVELPTPAAETEEAAEAIRKELAEAVGENEAVADGISVTATEDGVVISITDQIDFGMFEIGSAVPRRDLVLAMEKIGKILSERKGAVAINGHTDGRPFKSENYDNWRLSTARAHSAYFMLVRGGLAEQRIMEVAGFADRKLKLADDPFADANRRIEILLESGG